jgi:hypothetical protein
MVYLLFSPNYGLEVDFEPELAYGAEVPQGIDQFWAALARVAFSQQPAVDGGFGAVNLPTALLDVSPDIQSFWQALRPAIVKILAEHPTLVGQRAGRYSQPPPDPQIVGQFGAWMTDLDSETGRPRWQSRPERDQSYAVWVLKEFFDYAKGRGFAI